MFFVAPGRKEEDFSIILVDDLPTNNQPPAIIKNKNTNKKSVGAVQLQAKKETANK
jgi:hypothetical protein